MTNSIGVLLLSGAFVIGVFAYQHHTINTLDAELAQAEAAIASHKQTITDLTGQVDTLNRIIGERDAQLAAHRAEADELNAQLQEVLAHDEVAKNWWNMSIPDALLRMRSEGSDGH